MNQVKFTIAPHGERGWLATFHSFENDVSSGLFASCVADAVRIAEGVVDAVAGIDSVSVRFDPSKTTAKLTKEALSHCIVNRAPESITAPSNIIKIPVCYGGVFGPDFDGLMHRSNLDRDALIKAHSQAKYRVVTVGFAPGFAYCGPLDARLFAPRLDTPRPRLEPGSVGVAGGFTGVYSLPSPGGWRIIGRTPLRLFDPDRPDPFLFRAGIAVEFIPIDKDDFNSFSEGNA